MRKETNVRTRKNAKQVKREHRWVLFNNGCIHGIQRSELVLVRRLPHRSFVQNSIAVFSISKTFGLIAALSVLAVLVLLLAGCGIPAPQKGGRSTSTISRPGHTNAVTLTQSDNPKEPSKQTVQSEQTMEYVLPAGTAISVGAGPQGYGTTRPQDYRITGTRDHQATGQQDYRTMGQQDYRTTRPRDYGTMGLREEGGSELVILDKPVPVRMTVKDRTETSIGAAQKDTVREWAAKAANMQPVMWAGVVMMTLVAGVLIYFGWWTKAALAVAVGIGMIVLAQTLPDHGAMIMLGGLGVFALAALLILYAYYKGQLDKNHNGIPDFLEKTPQVPPAT